MNWFKKISKGFPTRLTSETLESFTPRARQVLALARKEAARLQQGIVNTEHLLLGLIHLGQGLAVSVLASAGLNLERARAEVEMQGGLGTDRKTTDTLPYALALKKVLERAAGEAKALNHEYVGVEHILLGILEEENGVAARVLKHFGVNAVETRETILKELAKKT
jgi:ATPases with chaperone activity, ATP-binding subunit